MAARPAELDRPTPGGDRGGVGIYRHAELAHFIISAVVSRQDSIEQRLAALEAAQ